MFTLLERRAIVAVHGTDRLTFLNGLISNDLQKLKQGQALYALLLTPQGRFLFDLFIVEHEDSYLLDVEAKRAGDLLRRLKMFKLRSNIELQETDWRVAIGHAQDGLSFTDPRLSALGERSLVKTASMNEEMLASYDQKRIALGVPEGGIELIPEKSIPLENGLDELHAINWDKGCYMGQELTARTRYRGLVRKRLLPLHIEGSAPDPSGGLLLEGKEVGQLLSISPEGNVGLGIVRLEYLQQAQKVGLRARETKLIPYVPDWMILPPLEETAKQ